MRFIDLNHWKNLNGCITLIEIGKHLPVPAQLQKNRTGPGIIGFN